MNRLAFSCLATICVASSGIAQAAIIGAAAPALGPGTGAPLAPGVNAALTSSMVVTGTPGGSAGNTVAMSLDVYSMDPTEAFSVIFPVLDGAGMEGTTTYSFAITLTNMLGANGDDPGDAGKEINGLDISLSPGPFALGGFVPVPPPGIAPPLSTYPLQFGGVVGTSLRWGGPSGGGGGVPFGTSQTFTFTASILDPMGAGADTSGTLGVVMVANPEPATLLLGGLAMIPGGIAVRRRRRRKAEAAASAA